MLTFIFTLAFLNETNERCKNVHSVGHTYLTFTWLKLCKQPEVNSIPYYCISSLGEMQLQVS